VDGSGGRTFSGAPQTQSGVTISPSHRNERTPKSRPTQIGTAHTGMDSSGTSSSRSAFNVRDQDAEILLQPETRPLTQEQLVNEVRGIYAGLVMVERKCIEIDQEKALTTNPLSNEQWQALIALHRTLIHEHHDFFLASQHPSSSPALRRLATKYAMPARMWRHGIHSFLELLRHQFPDSLEHMLSFVYLAYSMTALLIESVPTFEETWIECLGDLARYRMALEDPDLRDREIWSGVARTWYNKAADESPNVGRIQHLLAVLARPNIVQQVFYYSKALASRAPLPNTRESIMLLFNPSLERKASISQRNPLVDSTFIKAAALRFTRGSIAECTSLKEEYIKILDNAITRMTGKFKIQGPETASLVWTNLFAFGHGPATRLKQPFEEYTRQGATRETQKSDFRDKCVTRTEVTRSYYTSLMKSPSIDISPQDDVQIQVPQLRQM